MKKKKNFLMSNTTSNYLKGRVKGILTDLDHFDADALKGRKEGTELFKKIGSHKGDWKGVEKELRDFNRIDHVAAISLQSVNSLYRILKELVQMAESLSIDLEISEQHQPLIDYIKKDQDSFFVFVSGKRNFVNDTAKELFEESLKERMTDINMERAFKQIQQNHVDTDK